MITKETIQAAMFNKVAQQRMAHVIFCNDMPVHVVVEPEEWTRTPSFRERGLQSFKSLVQHKLEELAKEDYEANKWQSESYELYREVYSWHVAVVPVDAL